MDTTGGKDEAPRTNRERKLEGRGKQRRYVQGTRSYLHALTNSIARRAAPGKSKKPRS